jgi:hypothetical protein
MTKRLPLVVLLALGVAACSTYECVGDMTTSTLSGHGTMSGVDWDLRMFGGGRVGPEDRGTKITFQVNTTGGYYVATFRRPASRGAFRFEEFVESEWLCPPHTGIHDYSEDPYCRDDDGGTVKAQRIDSTGTLVMKENTFACGQTDCAWNIAFHLEIGSAIGSVAIFADAVDAHSRTSATCTHGPISTQ